MAIEKVKDFKRKHMEEQRSMQEQGTLKEIDDNHKYDEMNIKAENMKIQSLKQNIDYVIDNNPRSNKNLDSHNFVGMSKGKILVKYILFS